MSNHYGVVLPSLKIGGGNRVLLQFLNLAIANNNKCAMFFLNRIGKNFKAPQCREIYQSVFDDNIFFIIFSCFLLSLKIRYDDQTDKLIVSDPILLIFSFIYSNKKIIRFVQSNDYLVFDQNKKANSIFNFIYKRLFLRSQKYKYFKVLFNSKYSLKAYNKFLPKSQRYTFKDIINPGIFTLNYDFKRSKPSHPYTNIAIITSLQPRKGLKQFVEILKNSKLKKIQYYLISQDDIQLDYLNVTHIKPKNDNDYVSALKRCHFILSTSTFEGFGLPLIESMGLGLVAIAAHNQGMDEYFDNTNILIFNNIEEYDKNLLTCINNPKKYIKLSNKSVETASNFTEKNFYSSFINKIK